MQLQQALNNVLDGKTALGAVFNGGAMPFIKEEAARVALARACENLHSDIKNSVALDDDESLTAFIAKMAAFCAKNGWNSAEKLEQGLAPQFATIADALRESPELLKSKAGIVGILRKHHQNAAQGIARLRKELINDNEAPPLEMFDAGKHKLEELLTPRHLKTQSVSIGGGCCVGTDYNKIVLQQKGLEISDEGSEQYLTYAIKIRSGESRIFSLRTKEDDNAVATIEYDTNKKRISQIEGNPRQIDQQVPFFKDLCTALYQLKSESDLSGGITGLPQGDENCVLTRQGAYELYCSDRDVDDVLAGTIKLSADMSRKDVHKLAACANLTLDMTDCSNEWLDENLPCEVKANLTTKSEAPLILKHIRQAGDIWADSADQLTLPALEQAGDIYANNAIQFTLPVLQQAGNIRVDSADQLTLPALERVGYIDADSASQLTLPALEQAGDIWADSASQLTLPVLQQARHILANRAIQLTLPALQQAESIWADSAIQLTLPALQQVGEISAKSATGLDIPEGAYNSLDAPKLKKKNAFVKDAQSLMP